MKVIMNKYKKQKEEDWNLGEKNHTESQLLKRIAEENEESLPAN